MSVTKIKLDKMSKTNWNGEETMTAGIKCSSTPSLTNQPVGDSSDEGHQYEGNVEKGANLG